MRFYFFSFPALVMSGGARTHARTHTCRRPCAHTEPIFYWKLHNCQLLIRRSAGMMLIIIQQSWEVWGGAPQKKKKKKKKASKLKKKKYYILTVREVIMHLSAAVFFHHFFRLSLGLCLSPANQCAYSPAGPRWGVISASGLRFHQAFT